MIFTDTSALFALVDPADDGHAKARSFFEEDAKPLLTHNYVLLESVALVQRRLGPSALRVLLEDLVPSLIVRWVDEEIHRAASSALLAAVRRKTSFVDWVSFEIMRREGIEQAFTFDRDFAAQGFGVAP